MYSVRTVQLSTGLAVQKVNRSQDRTKSQSELWSVKANTILL